MKLHRWEAAPAAPESHRSMLTRVPSPGFPPCTVAQRLRSGPNCSCCRLPVGGGVADDEAGGATLLLEAEGATEDEAGGVIPPTNQTTSQLDTRCKTVDLP
jgi:hypothetical protein